MLSVGETTTKKFLASIFHISSTKSKKLYYIHDRDFVYSIGVKMKRIERKTTLKTEFALDSNKVEIASVFSGRNLNLQCTAYLVSNLKQFISVYLFHISEFHFHL